MRGPLGCNTSVTVALQGALRRALAIKQGQLGLLNEEQKTAWGRLNWQRAWRNYKAGHRGPPALARLTDSELRTVPSIPPPRQAGVKSVKELMRCAVHGWLPNKRMQLAVGPVGHGMIMLKTVILRSSRILLPAAFLPALGWGQQVTLGPTLTQILSSGRGVARDCLQREYGTGLGARLSVPVLTTWTTLQLAGRGYWVDRGSECVDGFPPPDGTYIEEDRVNLLSRSFITTDMRLAARLGEIPVNLAAGGGNAWHEGHNLPYLVLAAGISFLDRPNARLGLESEYQWLRVTSDQFRRTYQDFQLVAEESLGRVHEWSHAFIIGITLDIPL